jgi:hypothetical protein
MRSFLCDRIRLVRELLTDDAPDVSYADLVLILTAVISACAAHRWSGKGIDRKRFVELLVRESPNEHHLSWICVPALLVGGDISEADTPWGKLGHSTRVFRDDEIDLSFSDARNDYPLLKTKQIKNCSYAALIYEWLRCGYAHEYCSHANITYVPPSDHHARISYVGRITQNGITRMVSFHLEYLLQVAEYHAENLSPAPVVPPPTWWIDEL